MLYDLLHFLKTNKISGYPQNNDDTNVCLTPEPSVGRAEHMDSNKLYLYYKGMGFENIEGHNYWCGKIGNIIDDIKKCKFICVEDNREGDIGLGILSNFNNLYVF